MKKLALAIAISATASTTAQAAVTSVFTGTMDTLSAGSAYAGSTYSEVAYDVPQPVANSIDYTYTLVTNFGAFVSASVELNGQFSTLDATGIGQFAENTWTFINAVYDLTGAATDTTASVIGAYEFLDGTVETNGGVGGSIGAVTATSTLTGGTAVCVGGSCGSLTPGILSHSDLNYYVEFGTFLPVDVDLTVEFVSPSGGTGYIMSDAAAVPVPAAAWLFGSAILGLAGVSRRRK
jgi:hypothetical protein